MGSLASIRIPVEQRDGDFFAGDVRITIEALPRWHKRHLTPPLSHETRRANGRWACACIVAASAAPILLPLTLPSYAPRPAPRRTIGRGVKRFGYLLKRRAGVQH
jgi:hypothetical protein